jgi:3-oxoadipate enol-lactonase
VSSGVDVHHVEKGPRDAPVVILSHAIGTSLEIWDDQAAALSTRFRVIRYDHRGHGQSPVPPGPYAINSLGGDLLGLMDRLGIARASLCGLSLGAMTVLWVAAHAPDRVGRLIACCVSARPAAPEAWSERAATVRRGGIAAIEELVVDRWGYRDRRPDVEVIVRRLLLATPAEGYAACCDAIRALNLEPDLGSITAPTLLLAGALDPAAPPAAVEAVGAGIPGATLRVVEGAAHLASVEQPDAVTGAILDHLAPILDGRPT